MQLNLAGTLLAIALGAPAGAQQVQVYSEGKAIPVADPANAARPRIKDERKARRPLAERPDGAAIAAAHAAAFVRCRLDERRYPPEQAANPEEAMYFSRHASYLPVPNSAQLLLMDEYQRGKAIVDTGPVAIHTPQCPAGVGAMYWSATGGRILFATQSVTGIDFPGGSRALWTARLGKEQDVWLYEGTESKGFRKLISLPKEKVTDMYVPDDAPHVWILSQTEKLDLRTPRAWWRAASGTPVRKMDIVLRQVDLKGTVLSTVPIASGVPAGFAQFHRE